MASKKPKSGFRSVRIKNKDNQSPRGSPARKHSNSSGTPKARKSSNSSSKSKGDQNSRRKPSQSVMVRLKRLDTLRLNQRIKVRDYGYGTIRFLGCVHFAQGLFVGVELDEAMGKHDGSYHGKRYFTAKEKHGVLVKQHRVELLDILDPISPDLMEGDGVRKNRGSMHLNLDEEFSLMEREDEEEEEEEVERGSDTEGRYRERTQRANLEEAKRRLMVRNRKLTEEMDRMRTDLDAKEDRISGLKEENKMLRDEKKEFEEEMEIKIEELEGQLERITEQLRTKGEVLQKQIALHEKTKEKFKRKINEYDELKSKNQDTVQLIMYGDHLKDELVNTARRNQKRLRDEKLECHLEVERIKTQSQERLHKKIEEWIFDYGDIQ